MSSHAPFVLIPQYFGSIVFDRSTSRYLPFDHETTDLLRLAATVPFYLLAEAIADDEKRSQAWAFFHHFYSVGFFTLDHQFAGEILEVSPAADHLTGPLAVHLEVVAACNLTCTHCFAGALPRKEKPLTLSEIDTVFSSMARMGSFRLGLTGGEPLLRRDLFEIIDSALEHGLHPCITTNGLLITDEIARELGKRDMMWINVSLEGASAPSNDRVRGDGTFEQVLERLKILARYARFTLAFTIMRTNADEIAACAELAREVGASTAVFRPLYPVGTATDHIADLMPTFTQYNDALNALTELQCGGDLRAIDPFSPHLRAETQAITHANYGCGAGNQVCSISVSGDVNPCSFLGVGFVAANVRERSLESIWRESQVFQTMRALPGGTDDIFSGGCRARALVFNGSVNAPDPWLRERDAAQRISNVTFFDPVDVLRMTGVSK